VDPITSLVISHTAGKIFDRFALSFHTNVIERWSNYRVKQFLGEFYSKISMELCGKATNKNEAILNNLLENEKVTEVLFDAYRRVSLSRSKTIGPRVIGFFTARAVVEKREPNVVEESMMSAAEQLYDDELIEYSKFIKMYRDLSKDGNSKSVSLSEHGVLHIKWHSEQVDSGWRNGTSLSVSQLNLGESHGQWARKLNALDIIQTDQTESNWDYQEDSERGIDEPGSIREITWWITIWEAYFVLAEVIDAVKQSNNRYDE